MAVVSTVKIHIISLMVRAPIAAANARSTNTERSGTHSADMQ